MKHPAHNAPYLAVLVRQISSPGRSKSSSVTTHNERSDITTLSRPAVHNCMSDRLIADMRRTD